MNRSSAPQPVRGRRSAPAWRNAETKIEKYSKNELQTKPHYIYIYIYIYISCTYRHRRMSKDSSVSALCVMKDTELL